jgi:hypothetical protein
MKMRRVMIIEVHPYRDSEKIGDRQISPHQYIRMLGCRQMLCRREIDTAAPDEEPPAMRADFRS